MSQRMGREQQKRKRVAFEDSEDDADSEDAGQPVSRRGSDTKPAKRRRRAKEDDEEDDDDAFGYGTQGPSVGKITDEDREKLVSTFVRYCLFQDSTKLPIKQADIGKAVIKDYATKGRGLVQFVVAEGRRRLADTFGMELVELPKSVILDEEGFKGSSSYVLRPQQRVSSLLSSISLSTVADSDQFGLLCCMLVVIDMHDRTSTPEDEFYDSLASLEIRKGVSHSRFGDWESHFRTFCKQQYLVREKASHTQGQESSHHIGFGPRAIVEFGRVGIRHMTCRLIGTSPDPTRLKLLAERDSALHGRGAAQDDHPQAVVSDQNRVARRESVRPRVPPSVVDLVD